MKSRWPKVEPSAPDANAPADEESAPRPALSEEHSAAIAEFLDAEALRDRTGTPIPIDVVGAFADAYARRLEYLESTTTDWHGRDYLACAITFLHEGWSAQAIALGWSHQELFGLHPTHPWVRYDAMGAAYLANEPVAVTGHAVVLQSGLSCRRRGLR